MTRDEVVRALEQKGGISPIAECSALDLLRAISRVEDVWTDESSLRERAVCLGLWLLIHFPDPELIAVDKPLGSFLMYLKDAFPKDFEVHQKLGGIVRESRRLMTMETELAIALKDAGLDF